MSVSSVGSVIAGVVRIRTAMPLDPRDRAPRDQFLALSVLMTRYLFAMAYGFALVTYQIAHALSA